MRASSTERARLRRQRIQEGQRLIKTWASAEVVGALVDYGFLSSVEDTDAESVSEAVQLLLRGLCRRGVSLDRNWCVTDALARDDRPRGKRMLARLTECELLLSGRYSAFGRPPLSQMSVGADGA